MSDRGKIIYLRHGDDEVTDYVHDESLTHKGKKKTKKLAKKLIEEHGVPDIIYFSPFYRTRQTKKIMLKVISKYIGKEYKKIARVCDYRLSRFFTSRESENPSVRDATIRRKAPLDETKEEFNERLANQLNYIQRKHKGQLVWCVTHTLVIKYVIKEKNVEHGDHIPYLETIILQNS